MAGWQEGQTSSAMDIPTLGFVIFSEEMQLAFPLCPNFREDCVCDLPARRQGQSELPPGFARSETEPLDRALRPTLTAFARFGSDGP